METEITKGMKELMIKDCEEFEELFKTLDKKMEVIRNQTKEILKELKNG